MTKALMRESHINSRSWIEIILKYLKNIDDIDEDKINETDLKMLIMFHYTLWQDSLDFVKFKSLRDSFKRLYENKEIYDDIFEILNYNYEKIDFIDKTLDLGYVCPLDLHCTYSTRTFYIRQKPSQREGVLYIWKRI